jgi:small subunit ribosomal protein S2
MLTKKERLQMDRLHEGLMKNLAGIKEMNGMPDMLFIIDVRKEDIAVKEANRLGIPIVAVVDTNCSPEGISQVIPGNDDALRAIRLFASRIADAILEGQQIGTEGNVAAAEEGAGDEAAAPAVETAAPDIVVADQSIATAEATHSDPAGGSYAAQEPGASTTPEVKSEVEATSSEDVTELVEPASDHAEAAETEAAPETSETAGTTDDSQEESNEATAS